MSNELWLHASSNGGSPDFEVGFTKEPHHQTQATHQFYHQPHPYDPAAAAAASALNLMEYNSGDLLPYPGDPIVEQHQHYDFYEQPIESFGYYDYVAT